MKPAVLHFASETNVYPKYGQYNISFSITAVLLSPLEISTFMCPTLVTMQIVQSAAFTAFGSTNLKSVNLPWLGDICAEAPKSYIVIQLNVPSSSVWDRASPTMFEEKA